MPNSLTSSFKRGTSNVAITNNKVFEHNAMNNANHLLFFLFKVKTETTVDINKENAMIM
jgi:hypothetical protein